MAAAGVSAVEEKGEAEHELVEEEEEEDLGRAQSLIKVFKGVYSYFGDFEHTEESPFSADNGTCGFVFHRARRYLELKGLPLVVERVTLPDADDVDVKTLLPDESVEVFTVDDELHVKVRVAHKQPQLLPVARVAQRCVSVGFFFLIPRTRGGTQGRSSCACTCLCGSCPCATAACTTCRWTWTAARTRSPCSTLCTAPRRR